jgi:polyketide cyclase/dehydrase/lipid transport protein
MPTSIYPVTARCSIDDAFDYVADVTRHPEWATNPMRVERLTPGEMEAGARYRAVGHSEVWDAESSSEIEVTRHDRPEAFEISCRDAHGEFRHLFTFAEEPGGLVRIERHFTSPDILSEVARQRVAALMATVIEPSRRQAMTNLAQRLEAAPAAC